MVSYIDSLSILDNPKINWKLIIVGFTIGQYVFESYLDYRQYKVLTKKSPPASIKAEVNQETFDKSQKYSRSKAKFSFFNSTFDLLQNLAVIKYDLLPKVWGWSGYAMSKAAFLLPKFMGGVITQSLIFIITSQILGTIVGLPLSYYQNFVLEAKYGFNKQSIGLWITDTLKKIGLLIVLGSPVIAGILKIIDYYGNSFIFYLMGFILLINLIAMTIIPTLIMPLFNKFTPLEDGELKTAIENLASSQKFPLTKLQVVDGSKRSSHSNAYFTGLPWSKQIVLFDTLIEHNSTEETVAVLAHEIGHWRLNHIPKMLTMGQFHLFIIFSLFNAFVHNKSLYNSFGFYNQQPIAIGFTLFNDILRPLECILDFSQNLISRKHEYDADKYALNCGYSEELARSLIKLSNENLSSMNADWLFSAYHHSHPILPERLSALGYVSKEKISIDKPEKVEEVVEKKVEKQE
ncbi:STE24 [Candida pseudojiufengensis]|uniref:STE24 n=1 Tax=Candida pseudojiufengensis TaxID=497109 RepID=UPI0022244CC8|nr:STE24 [Candida pseudojiufengensis]KAI5965663.1 STE24 [Candida pseudojiufengensis]